MPVPHRWLMQLARRMRLVVGRAVVRLVQDAAKLQELQIDMLAGETMDHVERWQQYGFTAHPHRGAEAITLSVGGQRAHTVAIAVDDRRYRLTGLAEGEVAIYDDLGNVIHLLRDRILVSGVDQVEVTAPVVTINAATTHNGDITINGNVQISGALSATGQIASDTGVSIGALELGTHVHGGVTAGTDSTGGPQ